MKRVFVILLASLTMMVGLVSEAGASPQMAQTVTQVGRVRCEIAGNFRVVCYNQTPYVVRVRLKIYTTQGLYVRWFKMPYTRKVIYSPAYINRIRWRWWWA